MPDTAPSPAVALPNQSAARAPEAGFGNVRTTPTLRQRVRRSFRSSVPAMLSLGFLVLIVAAALLAPLIDRYSPIESDLRYFEAAPSAKHWLGTDSSGFDIWSRLLWGARTSLLVAAASAVISISIGTVVGAISGFYRGALDGLLMRITDGFIAFPDIVLVLMLASILGPSRRNVIIVIGVLSWTGTARLVRGQFLVLREQDWVLAARSIGVSNRRMIFKHMLPHVITQIVVAAAFVSAAAVLTEAGLSYLGLGVLPPAPSWGSMLSNAQSIHILRDVPWSWLAPGITLTLAVVSVSYVGDTLRRALDPRSDKPIH